MVDATIMTNAKHINTAIGNQGTASLSRKSVEMQLDEFFKTMTTMSSMKKVYHLTVTCQMSFIIPIIKINLTRKALLSHASYFIQIDHFKTKCLKVLKHLHDYLTHYVRNGQLNAEGNYIIHSQLRNGCIGFRR